jgi:hypothetical protein
MLTGNDQLPDSPGRQDVLSAIFLPPAGGAERKKAEKTKQKGIQIRI